MILYKCLPLLLILFCSLACNETKKMVVTKDLKTPSMFIEIMDSKVKRIMNESASITTIVKGLIWPEGPLWLKEQHALIFSDIPENKIYKWSSKNGLSVWLQPSGYTGPVENKREGSNGLLFNNRGQLVLCQHGDRRIAIMDATISSPRAKFITIADNWQHKKLNSPNDAAYYKGTLYFTDPPYGLPKQDEDPEKEIPFSGVYKIDQTGKVELVIDSISKPNGIAFSENKNAMYISNSDPKRAIWMKYTFNKKGRAKGGLLYDVTDLVGKEKGLPDGLKTHPSGYVFATGPGGIWVFSPEDKLSARIHIPQATSNCAFDNDYTHLYITADSTVIQVSMKKAKN